VLVPIIGDDISDDTYARACWMLAHPDSRLVLLHIRPPSDPAIPGKPTAATTSEPRWHRLAREVPSDRTFIDAVVGDPTTEILDEADRFHSDTILF
jgi:hypothetical protein